MFFQVNPPLHDMQTIEGRILTAAALGPEEEV